MKMREFIVPFECNDNKENWKNPEKNND